MRKNIWIPDAEVKEIVKASKAATETGGIGAYLVKLHKEKKAGKA
jgi:hypothetical protein